MKPTQSDSLLSPCHSGRGVMFAVPARTSDSTGRDFRGIGLSVAFGAVPLQDHSMLPPEPIRLAHGRRVPKLARWRGLGAGHREPDGRGGRTDAPRNRVSSYVASVLRIGVSDRGRRSLYERASCPIALLSKSANGLLQIGAKPSPKKSEATARKCSAATSSTNPQLIKFTLK